MADETKSGNLNKSKPPAPEKAEGTFGGKSDGETATLRTGNLPKASAVTTVDPNTNKGKAIKCAEKQNTSDEKPYEIGRNVIPNEGGKSRVCNCCGNKDCDCE
jgi:hypothetical protein